MAVQRIEVSNPEYSPAHTTYITVHSDNFCGRRDISIYNADAKGDSLPIVVLMHGVYGNHWVWMHLGGVHLVYERLRKAGMDECILVMPSDGGYRDGSGYLPLADGNYDSWIIDDVIAAVKDNIPAAGEQSNVYLSGLSMGGYGALRLGAKYANRIAGISAHSSITKMDDFQHFVNDDLSVYATADKHEPDLLYWMQKNRQALPPMRFDCGKDDVLFASNEALHAALTEQGIDHQYQVFDGEHSWEYWHQHVEKTLRFFEQLEKA